MRSTPKVTQILYSGLGGHGSVAFSLVEADNEGKWQHQMLFYGIEPLLPIYKEKCETLGISSAVVHKKGRNFLWHWSQVLRELRRLQPEVIIMHSMTLILPVSWYCHRYNCRLIAVEHTPNQVKRASEKKASALAMKRADHVVLLTEAYREELRQLLGVAFNEEKISIIPNGIDTSKWAPAEFTAKPQASFRIGMAARFSHSKDFNGLITAFAQLLREKQLPIAPELYLAGDGATKPAAEALAVSLGVPDKVHFVGNLNEAELLRFLQSLDLYVHASFGETMSTSIMQAMSCGLPVIGASIPGISNLLNGENGWLYDSDTSEALVEKIHALLTDSVLIHGLGKNARNYAEKKFSASLMLSKYCMLVNRRRS